VLLRLPTVPGRAKGARLFPSHATGISIRRWDTRCLIFPCKIPANLPDHPRWRALRGPREPRRKTPELSRSLAHRSAGARPAISAWRNLTDGVSRNRSRGSAGAEAKCNLYGPPQTAQLGHKAPSHTVFGSECVPGGRRHDRGRRMGLGW
jgi:hypothetical protein